MKPEGDHVAEGAVRIDRDQVKGEKMLFSTTHYRKKCHWMEQKGKSET